MSTGTVAVIPHESGGSGVKAHPPAPGARIRELAAQLGIHLPHPDEKGVWEIDRLDLIQKEALKVHADDLFTMLHEQRQGRKSSGRLMALQRARESPTMAIIKAAAVAVFGLIWTIITNPFAPLTHPVPWLYSIAALSLLTTSLLFVNFVLYIFEFLGGYSIMHWVSRSYGDNLSLSNLGHPHVYNPKHERWPIDTVLAAHIAMSGGFDNVDSDEHSKGEWEDDSKQAHIDGQRSVHLDLDVAKFLLLLSSLVYERKETLVSEAAYSPRWSAERLFAAEGLIHEKAFQFGLKFIAVSDFTDVAGSFCGVFYCEGERPFIIIAMKGTTPGNICEFLVDTDLEHISAESHLFGACHRGFYSSLFPPQAAGTRVNPYRRITQTVRKIAHDIAKRGKHKKHEKHAKQSKIPLYVTGHSLGAALAGVLYTRFLSHLSDLGNKIKLRDCFTYGQPRFGNASFVAGFERLLHMDQHCDKNLWRFCNEADVVCKVPPGFADNEDRRLNLTPVSLLNYGHIGTPVHLEASSPNAHRINPVGVRVGDHIEIVESGLSTLYGDSFCANSDFDSKAAITPITIASFLMKLFMPFMRDHFTSRYYLNLNRIKGAKRFRNIYDEGPQEIYEKVLKYVMYGNMESPGNSISYAEVTKHGHGYSEHEGANGLEKDM